MNLKLRSIKQTITIILFPGYVHEITEHQWTNNFVT